MQEAHNPPKCSPPTLPPKEAVQEDMMAAVPIPPEHIQQPAGVIVQIGPGYGMPNGIGYGPAPYPFKLDQHVNTAAAATGEAAVQGKPAFADLRLGSTHISSQDFANPSSGLLGVLICIALGFAFWYRQKYYQALMTGRSSRGQHRHGSSRNRSG